MAQQPFGAQQKCSSITIIKRGAYYYYNLPEDELINNEGVPDVIRFTTWYNFASTPVGAVSFDGDAGADESPDVLVLVSEINVGWDGTRGRDDDDPDL